jgi:hypothetical protein
MPRTGSQRRENAESYAARVGAARRKAITHCADFFERSGVEYDCLNTVHNTVRPELERIAQLEEFRPYNVASPNNLRRVGAEVHARWKART